MENLLLTADDILRRRRWTTQSARPGAALARLSGVLVAAGLVYGAAMGSFSVDSVGRTLQIVYAGVKVPLLLSVTFLLGLPGFFVLYTLMGLRRDFAEAVRALLATQAGLAVVLASFAPLTLLWYGSSADYSTAVAVNAVLFGIASLSAQVLLRAYYRPLIQRNRKHRILLWAWLMLYAFVGIQMAWLLRPFIGNPDAPVQFFRDNAFTDGNAYEVVARLLIGLFR
jgi:hypothetical protein